MAADDPEWQDGRKAAEDAAVAYRSDKRARGFPSLPEMFGEDIADRIAKWLEYRGRDVVGEASPAAERAKTTTLPPLRYQHGELVQ